jgi:hypothetical protein
MGEQLITVQARISRDLIDRIDAYRKRSTMRPSRSQAIRFLLESAMDLLQEAQTNEQKDPREG